ncbi:hypothetical protein CALVIDRAFT_565074 [Calocera viscosa TUFC12733]|uniref:NACHT domain-containing protein n=1 Tax=Calocera viscosa (strain TUFC12733) TaxID=1330018 RepID=A0A167KSI0_CALVF|nr:hypothetical protein CALVIDRAFT_565074 [Calocera viscosa TUFC12733]
MSDANISSVVRANTSGSASGSGTFIPGNRLGKAREFVRNLKVVAIDSTIKHVVDAATELVGISQALQQTNKEWKEFGAYIQEHVDLAVRFLSSPSVLDDSLRESLERLNGTLQELLVDARAARAEQGTIRQTTSHAQDSGVVIKQMREKLDRTLTLFNMTFNITNRLDVARLVLSVSDIERTIPDIAHTLEETRALQGPLPRVIMDLPITEGTSWDPDRTCLPGTRTWILDEIMDWIHGPDAERGAKVFWLTGPAGSGKTTVAHTVSQAAHDAGILLLSFFFNRMIPDRTSPNRLITALARAVATTDKRRALQMASVLQDDAGLASTSVTRQFQELVVKPASSGSQSVTRCVIVIDGVDECMDPEDRLLSILTSGTFVLPPWLRIVVTSRPLSKSHSLLEKATHITTHNFDLRSDDHRNDMKLYMSHRLELVARKRRKVLPSTAENLIEILAYRSDGLFLWASTVMDFMENHINPERHIKALLSWEGAPDAEARMDEVYAMVLSACPWHDEDFVAGYHLYMGMIEVGKGLSISTMQALSTRPDISPLDIFGYFRCLLRNWDNNDEAIEVLHSTFLAHTALAKGCIAFLNDELVFDRTGILECLAFRKADIDWAEARGGSRSDLYIEDRECTEAIYAAQAKNLPKHTEPATVPAEWLPASFQFQDIFFWARTGLCKAAEILSDLGWKEEALAIVSDDRVRYSLLGSQGEWSVRIMHPQTLLEVGNTEEALQVLQHTKSVLNGLDYLFEHPDFGWNLVQALGANLCSSGRAEEALPILKKMAHGSSYMFRPPTQTIASIHLWLSRALLVLGRLEEAAEAAGKGLKIQQKRLDMWPRSILLRQSVEELKQIIEMCSGSEALEEIELARAGKGEERGAAEGTEQCKSAEGNFRWTELVLAWLVAVYFSGLYFVFDQFCLHNL